MASTAAQTSLSAAATGTGTTVDFTTAKRTVTAVVIPSGTITAGAVLVEASQDGTNFVALHQVMLDRGANRGVSLNGQAYRYWRARVVQDLVGGGRVSVTFMEGD